MKTLVALFLSLFLLAAPAYAAEDAAKDVAKDVAYIAPKGATKESLIAFWEQRQKNDPQVKVFEATKEPGVYNFETENFPYKGRLVLLNASVGDYDSTYYQNVQRGIIEVELKDADETFFKKYARSYGAWTQDLNYYYNMKKGVWFTSKEWDAHSADFDKYAKQKSTAASCSPTANFWNRYGSTVISFGVLFLFLGGLLLFAKKQNKRVWDNHAKALSEQQRGLKMVEDSQKVALESLAQQLEHTRLLQEILAALKK